MIRHLAVYVACGLCLFTAARAQENESADSMIEKTLLISAEEKERLSSLEAKGIMEIRPVALPTGSHLIGDNHHLGWPVGTKVGSTLLCAYHQTLRHHGKGARQDADSSDAVIDTEAGVQHIFIYCGRYSTPAGIYRISRTLDTAKLKEAMIR